MNRRAESAEETRRRIVEATHALHDEKGIAATSYRDIAERADVGIGTVYHHFPTYLDVVEACGAHVSEQVRPPLPQILDEVGDTAGRVRRMVAEIFAFYRRFPGFDAARSERDQFSPVDRFMSQQERNRRAFVDAAFRGVKAGKRTRALAFALLEFRVYRDLVDSGLSHEAAVDEIVNTVLSRLNLPKKRSTR
jgi:AcrR family transcriptional regulator